MASKRRIVVFDRVTVDGYFAGPDGGLNWAVPEDELDRSAASRLSRADTILFGRTTYEMFESFWPHALGEGTVAEDPHAPGRFSPAMRAMAVWINEATKVVFSKTMKTTSWNNSRLLREFDPREVEAMKKQPGKDMMIFGSGSIVSLLTRHGLIDEYELVVTPTILGSGKSLIHGLSTSSRLKLLEAKAYPSGNVLLRYAPG